VRAEHDRATKRSHVAILAASCLSVGMVAAAAATAGTPQIDTPQRDVPWESMLRQELAAVPGGRLQVRVDDADVAIGVADGQPAEVVISLRSNDMEWARGVYEQMAFSVRESAGAIVVESDPRPREEWRRNRWMSIRVEARVPSRFDLDILTQDGDVALGSFEGTMQIVTQDGDVTVESLRGPSIELRSQDGDLSAAALVADRVALETQDGDIDVDSLAGATRAHTSDGDIRIGAVDAADVELESSDGDVFVAINTAGRLLIRTGDGDISIVAPATLQADVDFSGEEISLQSGFSLDGSVNRRRAQGRINGGGAEIRAHTNDGEVRLLQQRNR
jgi:hypothetical protein